MTPNELRIRCAEIEHWTEIGTVMGDLVGTDPSHKRLREVPEYTESIDAINEAVLRLSDEKRGKWVSALTDVLMEKTPDEDSNVTVIFIMVTASAEERAEAYARIHA